MPKILDKSMIFPQYSPFLPANKRTKIYYKLSQKPFKLNEDRILKGYLESQKKTIPKNAKFQKHSTNLKKNDS